MSNLIPVSDFSLLQIGDVVEWQGKFSTYRGFVVGRGPEWVDVDSGRVLIDRILSSDRHGTLLIVREAA